jgi:hypothetical protein
MEDDIIEKSDARLNLLLSLLHSAVPAIQLQNLGMRQGVIHPGRSDLGSL